MCDSCVITIAKYTKDFIVENMGVPAELITNVYNGTDTAKFKRTPDMAAEALKRYPCATPENAFVVGCIGSYEERKAQSLLLKAAKKLVDDKKLPNIHCLVTTARLETDKRRSRWRRRSEAQTPEPPLECVRAVSVVTLTASAALRRLAAGRRGP